MKIAVIGSKGLPPKQGGIEHHCAEIYPRMVDAGHTVDLYARASYTGHPQGSQYTYQGVNVKIIPSLPMRGLDAFASSAIAAIIASGHSYDVIHFHALGPALFSPLSKVLSPAKVVVTCHGLDWQREKWGAVSSSVIKAGEKAAVRYADSLVVVSDVLRTYFQCAYRRRATYIENAPVAYTASDESFSYGKKLGLKQNRYVLFLGRLVPEKCPDLLIKAFRAIQAEGWQLAIAGGQSDAKGFKEYLLHLVANDPNIIFTGELGGAYLAEIVRGAGLFCLPSNIEGLPLALLEAMQEGIPVVVSDIPVHHQLVGPERGAIFEMANLDSLHHQLGWAMSHPSEMAERAKRAKQYIRQNYDWQRITQKYISVYQSLLTGSQVVPPITGVMQVE